MNLVKKDDSGFALVKFLLFSIIDLNTNNNYVMAVNTLTWFVRKKGLLLTFLCLFSLFISENILSKKEWTKDSIHIKWLPESKGVLFTILVYDYAFGSVFVHGYLERCRFEACIGSKYYKLMDIHTKQQKKYKSTTLYFNNKLQNALIQFNSNVVFPSDNGVWPERLDIMIKVPNEGNLAMVTLVWYLYSDFDNISHIRISGKWSVDPPSAKQEFSDIIYFLDKTSTSKLKSDTPDLNTTIYDNNSVVVLKDSETIAIKGVGSGEIIKVYNTSGVAIKSVISNNDVVQIALPAKQIYFVHVGTSRYKVAL